MENRRQDKAPGIRIFVSHSSVDNAFVEKLIDGLAETGGDWFYDKYSIVAGDLIPALISEALEQADFFVCILSKASVRSQWVTQEWSAAVMRSLSGERAPVLIPILYEDVNLFYTKMLTCQLCLSL